jgi:hypothetical protein
LRICPTVNTDQVAIPLPHAPPTLRGIGLAKHCQRTIVGVTPTGLRIVIYTHPTTGYLRLMASTNALSPQSK